MPKRPKKKRLPAPTAPASAAPPPASRAKAPPNPGPKTARPPFNGLTLALGAAIILALGLFIFWPALRGAWLWDDRDLIADNPLIHDPDGWWKIWLTPSVMFDFLPLKITTEWIEWRLFGEQTLGYHLVSLVLHLASALLLWRLFRRLGLQLAWLGAVIWLVHPVQVESVAWIAELKNTLSMPFFLLAMTAWIDHEARGRKTDYALALGCFLLAMLMKSTMAMFPFVILLYAWWRRGRVDLRDLLAAAPFFAVSLADGMATVVFLNRTGGEQYVILGGLASRFACAALSLAFYFSKSILPVNLMTIYPLWRVDPPSPWQYLPWLVFAAVIAFLWTRRATWGRHALLGLGFFVLNLAPFLGLNAGSYMNYTWVMDHLLYIPIIGLIGLAIAAAARAGAQMTPPSRRIGAAALALAVAWMTWTSHAYAIHYRGPQPLWSYNIAVNPAAALPHNDLGVALATQGHLDEAGKQFLIATRLDTRYLDAYHNYAEFLILTGRPDQALPVFKRVLEMAPNIPEAHFQLGIAFNKLHRNAEAIEEYQQTLRLDPTYVNAYENLSVSLAMEHRWPEAVETAQTGLRVAPGNQELQAALAKILQSEKDAATAPNPPSKK